LLFNLALESVIRRVYINQDGLKLNGTHYTLFYSDDINNILVGSAHTIKKNAESLVVASKEFGLDVNADISKYVVVSRHDDVGRSHNVKIDVKSFERVEQFKYLVKTSNEP
jgi:hypothetical protein